MTQKGSNIPLYMPPEVHAEREAEIRRWMAKLKRYCMEAHDDEASGQAQYEFLLKAANDAQSPLEMIKLTCQRMESGEFVMPDDATHSRLRESRRVPDVPSRRERRAELRAHRGFAGDVRRRPGV